MHRCAFHEAISTLKPLFCSHSMINVIKHNWKKIEKKSCQVLFSKAKFQQQKQKNLFTCLLRLENVLSWLVVRVKVFLKCFPVHSIMAINVKKCKKNYSTMTSFKKFKVICGSISIFVTLLWMLVKSRVKFNKCMKFTAIKFTNLIGIGNLLFRISSPKKSLNFNPANVNYR